MTQAWAQDPVFQRAYNAMIAQGDTATGRVNGLRRALRLFAALDTNGDGTISPDEFQKGLAKYGVTLSRSELIYLVTAFDHDRDGKITFSEFKEQLLVQSLTFRRRNLIQKAWDALRDGAESVRLAALHERFDASAHPGVRSGETTAAIVSQEYFGAGENSIDADQDGVVSRDEFLAFFGGVSATVPHDDVFEMVLLGCFRLDSPQAPRLDATQRQAFELSASKGIIDPLATLPGRREEVFSGTVLASAAQKKYCRDHLGNISQRDDRNPVPPRQPKDWTTTSRRDFVAYDNAQFRLADPLNNRKTVPFSPTGNKVVDAVRKRILQRVGVDGFAGVRRVFRMMNKDGSEAVSPAEFQRAMDRLGVDLTPAELNRVMTFVDRDGAKGISLSELLRAIRGTLPDGSPRMPLIVTVFQMLDTNGNGVVELRELVPKYDTTKHPLVTSGVKSKEEVVQDFVAVWDKNRDGKITLTEFVDYYSDISAGIDDDQYFELMMRNAWHVSGGVGVAQNTTCRRVLAEFRDGSQKVLEIRNDLGVSIKNVEEMKRRLEADGHKNIERITFAY